MKTELLNAMLEAAHAAGDLAARERAACGLEIHYKSSRELVTSVDIAAEKIILERLLKLTPGASVLAEESAPQVSPERLRQGQWWIIDPIDGTNNYARGHAHVAVSIAYAEEGIVLAGVVHAPFLEETFQAVKGGGAFLNGNPIRVRTCPGLTQALVATGFPYAREDAPGLAEAVCRILSNCQDVRRCGACALDLAWLAAGRLDAYYESVRPWDMAAGMLLVKEAGGVVQHLGPLSDLPEDINGANLLASSAEISKELAELLRGLP